MTLFLEVLQIVAPVFILASIGWGWVRLGLFYDVEFVTRLTMTLAIPCLIFVALYRTEIEPAALSATVVATLVAYLGVGAVLALGLWGAGLSQRTFLAPLTFGNTGNLGLPLALFAFGELGFDYAVVIFAVMAILSFTIGLWVVAGRASPLTVLKEPILGATLAGGVFLVMGWDLPRWTVSTLDLIGQIGIPLMLITLGVAISRLRPSAIGRAVGLSVVKLSVCFAIAYGTGLWFRIPDLALAVMVVQVTTPVAVTSYMLAEKYGAEADEVAGLVVVSTLISVLALPAILALFIAV